VLEVLLIILVFFVLSYYAFLRSEFRVVMGSCHYVLNSVLWWAHVFTFWVPCCDGLMSLRS